MYVLHVRTKHAVLVVTIESKDFRLWVTSHFLVSLTKVVPQFLVYRHCQAFQTCHTLRTDGKAYQALGQEDKNVCYIRKSIPQIPCSFLLMPNIEEVVSHPVWAWNSGRTWHYRAPNSSEMTRI